MIRFDSDSKENMQKAYIGYLEEIKPFFPGRYLIASVEMYSSEGNTYYIDADFDDEPTDELLTKLAEADWNQFYKGISPDEEKETTIEKLKAAYIIVDRNKLYPLFASSTWIKGKDCGKEYFLTEEAARKETDKFFKELELDDDEAMVSCEIIEKITIDDNGKEISEKVAEIPYRREFRVSLGYGENVQAARPFVTYENVEAATAKEAAEHIYNGLEPEDTKNLIIETSFDGEREYFDFEDSEPEL